MKLLNLVQIKRRFRDEVRQEHSDVAAEGLRQE